MIRLNEYRYKEEYTYHLLQALKYGEAEAFRKDFQELHPSDRARFFLELSESGRCRVYSVLSPGEFGEMYAELSGMQKRCMHELNRPQAVHMLNKSG
ncbi:hypothetical protein M5W83_01675 [Paenibacillus thiaminolyticus]|uniref:Magnesium transporter n=1 Tax=Paenibacillus thiaminolyticus TaxID=49283 RepID=A0AAP9DSQ1_PANTH|nr:hypothetical protein [Paenibacillus thiaminolyticus]MCY9538445.1 hypothetical protein [Paenibacillus thiaminolyticus]MCY9601182.1 hypothetical protein [Paenibacillus thiaminolyticus]MCY9605890.1 hypothetical protein [Paenibacillus thiaminolyticus]MCY9611231.1 hypothetical protein [Paenibacillus thiaminolyticus]MCY9617460.1 hypothetical protein [Paenibacillus thiaminolyticus]